MIYCILPFDINKYIVSIINVSFRLYATAYPLPTPTTLLKVQICARTNFRAFAQQMMKIRAEGGARKLIRAKGGARKLIRAKIVFFSLSVLENNTYEV